MALYKYMNPKSEEASRDILPSLGVVIVTSLVVLILVLRSNGTAAPLLLGSLVYSLSIYRDSGLKVKPDPARFWPSAILSCIALILLLLPMSITSMYDTIYNILASGVYLSALLHFLATDLAASRMLMTIVITDMMIAHIGFYSLGYLLLRAIPATLLTYLIYRVVSYPNDITAHATVFATSIAIFALLFEGFKGGIIRWKNKTLNSSDE